ncbi:hypothetical protein BVRB_9g220540 [Beta vulgaris subsp. vulgaris]|nr:hypothetical protein BVRB_9g220540 [Beta vulgaris subsp. vulgaris]
MILIFFTCFFCLHNLFHTSNLILATSNIHETNHQGSESNDNNTSDMVALLAIKSEIINDPQGVLNSWNDSLSICEWQGVTCGATRKRVVSLHLVSYSLQGTLSPSVGNLSFLHHLILSDNDLSNHIPPQIGRLLRLRTLVLERNSFEGQIPANISQCSKLEILSLAGNHLSGNIPPQLSKLSNLRLLLLQRNQFTGDLLNTVMNMTSLQKLSAASNFFQGTISNNIGSVLRNLTYIGLAQNQISGTIPSSFYNLSSLNVVDLDLNRLEGTLPFDIGFRLPQLTYFKISGNSFHGSLPVSLSNLTQLQGLAVYSNNFAGKFKFSGTNMPNLERLDISLNYLGMGESDDLSFIQTLDNCTMLRWLECGSNRFGGNLPHSFGNLSTEITVIDFQQNLITGSIPPELFNLINLERLGLSDNQLTGYLPQQIKNLRKIEHFSCSNNHLIGDIPNTLGNLSRLSELYMDNNSFEGTIPSSLGECTNLLYLTLSKNNLTGPLPSRLLHASMLLELRLDHNHLNGAIPVEVDQLRNMVVLDVSGNSFSGDVPSSLGSCIGLLELHMGGNLINGSIPQSFKSLTSLVQLNLSHNRFSGQIPSFLSNFSLLRLDLSYNDLEGEVPRKGVFANLSAVTILGNSKICGGISELHLPTCLIKTTTIKRSKKKGGLSVVVTLIIAIASLVVSVSMVSVLYFLLCSRKKLSKVSSLNLKEPFPKVSYDMILKATDRFSEENLVGAGGFGSVYKGVLDLESSIVVAVKVIRLEKKGARKSFIAECEALRNIRHRNLVKIVTACSSTDFQGNDVKALVYEYMPNGNLQQWIHVDQLEKALSLLQRVNIAIDVACALDYLHNNGDVPIIHCDLKPSNVLLDNDMVAHVGDFGLATFSIHASTYNSSSVAVKGTVGYAAPEYGLGSMVSKEGDMYSYGIVLIEMMTGKSPTDRMFEEGLDLHKYAKSAFSEQSTSIIDPMLLYDSAVARNGNQAEILAEIDSNINCIRSVIEIGVKCSMESPQDRMRIEDAILELHITRDVFLKELRNIGEIMQF